MGKIIDLINRVTGLGTIDPDLPEGAVSLTALELAERFKTTGFHVVQLGEHSLKLQPNGQYPTITSVEWIDDESVVEVTANDKRGAFSLYPSERVLVIPITL